MTAELIKDIRLSLDNMSKEHKRLSDDLRILSEYLLEVQREYSIKGPRSCSTCLHVDDPYDIGMCTDCKHTEVMSNWEPKEG